MSARVVAARGIDAVLVVVMGVVGVGTVFRLFGANGENGVVAAVGRGTDLLLAPFHGVFGVQNFLFTALVGVLGYCTVAGLAHMLAGLLPGRAREGVGATGR
jgi:hypothetical protein